MKHIINLFIFCIFSITASSQIEVSKILKPSNGQCNGTIVFSFVASELPGTLVMLPDDQSLDGGSISIDGTSYTLKNVCPGDYTFTFIDNHECVTEKEVDLGECDLDDIYFNVVRVSCEIGSSYDIIPGMEGNYYYEWSNGSTESSLSYVTSGDYYVSVTDEFGCSTVEVFNIEMDEPSIVGINQPTENGDGCDGSVQIFADGLFAPFIVNVRVNGVILYSSTYTEYEQGAFTIPLEFCFYNENEIIVTDVDGCYTVLKPQFENLSDCEDGDSYSKIVVSELWNQSDGDNGKVRLTFNKPFIDETDYTFSLFTKDDEEGYSTHYQTQTGNAFFENLPAGYYLATAGILNENLQLECVSFVKFSIHSCPTRTDYYIEGIQTKSILNVNDGEITFKHQAYSNQPIPCYNCVEAISTTKTLISPSGIPIYAFTENKNGLAGYSLLRYRNYKNLSEEGIYNLKIDNGCGTINYIEIELNKCPPRVSIFAQFNLGSWFDPYLRDDLQSMSGYEKLLSSYDANGIAGYSYSRCQLDYNIDYVSGGYNSTDDEYFRYEPTDPNNPCAGGILKSWFAKYIGEEKTIVFNSDIEITNEALYQFDWNNTELDNSVTNLSGLLYKVKSEHMTANKWDICENGTYCLFESLDIFSNAQLSELLLLSTCSYDYPFIHLFIPTA